MSRDWEIHETAPASVEMPAASTLALHDQAMANKPCPFAYWRWRVEQAEEKIGISSASAPAQPSPS